MTRPADDSPTDPAVAPPAGDPPTAPRDEPAAEASRAAADPDGTAAATAADELLAELADDFLSRLRRGQHPTVADYLNKHPRLGERIRKMFAAIAAIEESRPIGASLAGEQPGGVVGRYRLLERIGEGGFGVVFMAEQQFPVRRRVALKLIKAGLDTKQVIARFEAERQALAMMEHEHIAKVLDAGATETGRPYFVMELVHGVPITAYCDANRLSPRQRLELFVPVCRAVQHAHTKGIIHRDLKPTNVLVTLHDGVAVPKVIDFGVAKAIGGAGQPPLTERTLFTQFAQMVGTPLYMSPEQAEMSGLDVDTRSDVYSLGVLLYELLTGTTPFDKERLRQAAHDEVRRIIREEEPPRPSTRISTMLGAKLATVSADRKTEPRRLGQLVRGELDWIVMRALEKDRARRYETPNGLAADVRRYLDNEPVTARPTSSVYRLRKLIVRNKLAVTAAAAVAAALLLGIAFSTWQAARVNAALAELRTAAPTFAAEARSLAARGQFDEAIAKLDYAARLRPDVPEYPAAKGDLLESQLRVHDAAIAYRAALRLRPNDARLKEHVALCDELSPPDRRSDGANSPADGAPRRESLSKLYALMLKEQRPAAELILVARRLGAEQEHLLELWLERLKDLPVSPKNPLAKRLTIGDDGLLALDLHGTSVSNLAALEGMPLGKLDLSHCHGVEDLEPLRRMPLKELVLTHTGVRDLAPLNHLPGLQSLDLSSVKISDIAPLKGMSLRKLSLRYTNVTNLTPLAGMPLLDLDVAFIPATDFAALSRLRLKTLSLHGTRVGDLSFLSGVPLEHLSLSGCTEARDFGVLASIKSLEVLRLPRRARERPPEETDAIEALRTHPSLRQLDDTVEDLLDVGSLGTVSPKEAFWNAWDRDRRWAQRLSEGGGSWHRLKNEDGTWWVAIENQPKLDVSIFDGAPISELQFSGTPVDLAKLKGLPLHSLTISDDPKLRDLTPLKDLPLRDVRLFNTGVSDISPLKNLRLTWLALYDCDGVTDVSPMAEMPTLEVIVLPRYARNVELLRNLAKVKRLSFTRYGVPVSTDLFWKTWDGMTWARKLEAAGIKYRFEQHPDGMYEVWVLRDRKFRDCSIFQGSSVRQLSIDGTSVTDLSPLKDMPLRMLGVRQTPLADISPLRGSVLGRALTDFYAFKTKINDVSPIADCTNLRSLDLGYTGLRDLNVLAGLKQLRRLWISGLPKVSDLSPLVTLPLELVDFSDTVVTDVSPLLKCASLQSITLSDTVRNPEVLRRLQGLQKLSYVRRPQDGSAMHTTAQFWDGEDEEPWLAALRWQGLVPRFRRLDNDTNELVLDGRKFSDLSVLKGAKLARLHLINTQVADLRPLRGMPLKMLFLANTKVTDLSPLEGMPLTHLQISGTAVSDLSPIRDMMLIELLMSKCTRITDLSALKGMTTLTYVTLPPDARGIDVLRDLPNLKRISYAIDPATGDPGVDAADFWAEYDRRRQVAATQPESPKPASTTQP